MLSLRNTATKKFVLTTILSPSFLRKTLLKDQLHQLNKLPLPPSQLRKNKMKILKLMKFKALSKIFTMRNRLTQLLQLSKMKLFLSLMHSQSKLSLMHSQSKPLSLTPSQNHLLSLKYQLLKFLTLRKMLRKMHLTKTMHSSCSTPRLQLLSPLLFLSKIFSQFSVSHSPSIQSFKRRISLKNACTSLERTPMTSLK